MILTTRSKRFFTHNLNNIITRNIISSSEQIKLDELATGILQKKRISLSRGITLVESTNPMHMEQADYLLQTLSKRLKEDTSKSYPRAFRIAISGSPGVGKSTFLEAFGMHLLSKNKRVAIVAIDPSSAISGGSILGDKTRMPLLSAEKNAYIRPSPSRGTLGGITKGTSEVMFLCECGGFDTVIVETVGVGQSETVAANITDAFVVLVPPASGDALQGIKRGIIEMADLIVVNKADGPLIHEAERVAGDLRNALVFQRPRHMRWRPKVLKCSALQNTGIDKVWETIQSFFNITLETGEFQEQRKFQLEKTLWDFIDIEVYSRLKNSTEIAEMHSHILDDLFHEKITIRHAAMQIADSFFGNSSNKKESK